MGIGAAIGSAVIGASSANSAADAQLEAAEQQTALQEKIYNETTDRFSPWYDSGTLANEAYMYELGFGAAPTYGGSTPKVSTFTQYSDNEPQMSREEWLQNGLVNGFDPTSSAAGQTGTTMYRVNGQVFDNMADAQAYANANATEGTAYGGYEATPGYNFLLDQGLSAVDSSAAAQGNLLSSANIQNRQDYQTGLAQQDYSNYLARLSGVSSSGQNAAGNMASAGQNYATGASNALSSAGNAAAAGSIATGNALTTGINNALGAYQYQQQTGGNWWG